MTTAAMIVWRKNSKIGRSFSFFVCFFLNWDHLILFCLKFLLLNVVAVVTEGSKMWSSFIEILDQKDAAHSDLAHLAISLINKVW